MFESRGWPSYEYIEASSPSATSSGPPLLRPLHTPQQSKKSPQPPLNVILPPTAPATPPAYVPGEPTLTPPPRSPGAGQSAGDARPLDGTSSDKSSETAVAGLPRTPSASGALTRKESYKAQRQHYRREKKRAASALLHSIEDPSVIVLADWLKVRGSLKSWTKLWCVLKPGLLLLYKSPKAKSSHWVGTVLLTSCQVIERPSKKDGFCFKLYHPLEQSIWAPRGPHNESIGAVVQPLPTAHLIFRAPSQAAGHCWLDGLELALRCSNAMLRCSRSAARAAKADEAGDISHEELEKHFNEHVLKLAEMTSSHSPTPLLSVLDYSPKHSPERKKTPKIISKWAQFVESIEILGKDHEESSDSSDEKKDHSFLDYFLKKDCFDRNAASTSSMKGVSQPKIQSKESKSLMCSPMKDLTKKTPILRCFEIPKLPLSLDKKIKDKSPTALLEENMFKLVSNLPKRRSSTPTPSIFKLPSKTIRELRTSGAKTDSENDDFSSKLPKKKQFQGSEVICTTPDNFVITKTAPSLERFKKYSSSSTDEMYDDRQLRSAEKFSLIDCSNLPSAAFEAIQHERRDDRVSSQNVYVAGRIVNTELAGAASDSEISDGMPDEVSVGQLTVEAALRRIAQRYSPDPDTDIGQRGELVEEVSEENKSLLWFLMKQVRPGMDLSKVVLPTFILEPRSFLDKLSDSYYHADILATTQNMPDPYERFKTVVRWFMTGLYKKPKGLKKPYNPVLGEVFRCCWKTEEKDDIIYYVAEQVSHHPPVSAFYVSNRKNGFVIEGSLLARSKFYGNSTSAILEGCARVFLLPWNETYFFTAPYAHCKGIVIGTLSMEYGGKVHLVCEQTGYQADIEFKLRSFLGGADQTNLISGRIKKGKDTVATMDGYWDNRIDLKDKRTGEESNLIDVAVLKEQRLRRYLVNMHHQTEFESAKLWVRVSEAIGNDDQVAATEAKTIIEEAQRARERNRNNPWIPRYFQKEQGAKAPEGLIDQGWRYKHSNVNTWQPEEKFEYEEDFVIVSVCSRGASPPPRVSSLPAMAHAAPLRGSDTDDYEDLTRARSKTSTRTLKHSLQVIDSALRDQTAAIERLTRRIENMSEKQTRNQNVGRIQGTSHVWDILGGFVLAVVLQALLNWMFYQKD